MKGLVEEIDLMIDKNCKTVVTISRINLSKRSKKIDFFSILVDKALDYSNQELVIGFLDGSGEIMEEFLDFLC